MDVVLSESDIGEFQRDGAVCLRGVFSQTSVEAVRRGIAENLRNPSEYSERLTNSPDDPGSYFNDYGNWRRISQFEEFVYDSPAAEIAGKLMQSKFAVFYHEHVLTKDPGTCKVTPWHQDQPYYPVEGDKNCSIWMPVDPVPSVTSLKFIKGSHKWNKWFYPRKFATETNYRVEHAVQDRRYEEVPTNLESYEVLSWDTEPGDCIVFHMRTLHSAPSNPLTTHRRVLSTRWLGDDATFGDRPWEFSPPFTGGLAVGQPFLCEIFPKVWTEDKP